MSNRLFGTDGMRGRAGDEPLTESTLFRLGQALGTILSEDLEQVRVVIGHDGRESGEPFCAAITDGLCAAGVEVEVVGLAPTPAVAFLTAVGEFNAGVVISASHNPAHDNGVKLLAADGSKCTDEFELKLEQLLLSDQEIATAEKAGECRRSKGLLGDYIAWYRNEAFPNLDLSGQKILVDCANGAWSQLCPRLLKAFGAESVTINDRPDGNNINLNCGAMHPELIVDAVREHACTVALCVDGDGDRGILCDSNGRLLDGDVLLAGIAELLNERKSLPQETVVATVMSNLALEQWCLSRGMKLERTPVGDRHVAATMREHQLSLGGEKSGHMLFGPEHGMRGDGLYTLFKVLNELDIAQKTVSEFAVGYVDMPQELRNLAATRRAPLEELPALQEATIKVNAELGLQGRTVVRFSGTELKLRLMVEANTEALVSHALDQLQDAARKDGIIA